VGAVVMVEGQPAILYVCESPGTIRQPLTRAGFRVIATAPAAVPTTAAGFASIAGVVLDDVPAERLPSAAIDALTAYVERAGGGLLILGSPRTLTLDGYPATTLGRVLPIDLRPRSGQRAVPVEIMLLFDKSGSMADVVGGTSKIEIARQAVAQAVQLVPESDAVGVLAFDSRVETVTPLAPHPDAPALRTALERIRPGGSTAIAPALETALQSFRAAGRPANTRRHVILISDGRTSDADAARLMTLATTGVAQISAVAIGSQANQALLETLARTSGGRAYFPENLQDLPRMVAREAVRSSAGGIVEEPFTPRVFRHPVLEGLDANALPSLNGYVVSAAKPSATVILSSHLEDPILTAWRAGLGRVAVFTADLASAWSVRLRSSPDGGQLWRQTVRWLSRRDHDEALRLTLADAAGGPRLHVDAEGAEGEVVPLTIVAATVTPPDGSAIDVTLEPSAPGRYDAPLPFDGAGSYVVALTAVAETSGTEHRLVRTLYWSADREMHTRGADVPFLSRLASLSGGRLLAADGSPFEVPRVTAYADASTWLAATVLAMFILELTLLRHLLTKRRAVHA
jgi:Ca-activated chloride channel homolog